MLFDAASTLKGSLRQQNVFRSLYHIRQYCELFNFYNFIKDCIKISVTRSTYLLHWIVDDKIKTRIDFIHKFCKQGLC